MQRYGKADSCFLPVLAYLAPAEAEFFCVDALRTRCEQTSINIAAGAIEHGFDGMTVIDSADSAATT